MKKILVLATLIVFLTSHPVVASNAQGAGGELTEQRIDVKEADERVRILQAYLAKFNSPLQNHASDFIEAADTYDLDWKLVPAIAGVESTFGRRIPGGFNAWGWGVYGDQALGFKSWRDGIFTVSAGLRKNYVNKGLTEPYSMNRVYAASPTWGAHVSFFLNDLNKFEAKYNYQEALLNLPMLAFENRVGVDLVQSEDDVTTLGYLNR